MNGGGEAVSRVGLVDREGVGGRGKGAGGAGQKLGWDLPGKLT